MKGPKRVFGIFAAVSLAVALAGPGSAMAKPAKISGKLSKPGYTVIALAASGEARTDRAPKGRFKLRPAAKKVTLHLRAPDGTYGGPVVIAKAEHGKEAILGLRPGAKLGKVKIKSGKGYARLAKRLPDKYVEAKRTALAKKGVPIGSGNLGLIKSKNTKGGVPGDVDLDGIPAPLDIDDDGDLILDDYDRSTQGGTSTARSSNSRLSQPRDGLPEAGLRGIGTSLTSLGVTPNALTPLGAVNVNGGSSDEQVAVAQRSGGTLIVGWKGIDPGSGELDCGTLVYCSAGGTGEWMNPATAGATSPFPECCDADGDGRGSLIGVDLGGGVQPDPILGMGFLHGATSDQIHAGDVLIERGTVDGRAQESVATVGFVFATHPAVAAYDDGQGASQRFSYPLAEPCLSMPATCAAPVRAGPNGEVVLTLTFWRPQRSRIDGEPGEGRWMDVGNLAYTLGIQKPNSEFATCPQNSYVQTDPNLTPLPPGVPLPSFLKSETAFADLRGDQPSDPTNTFTNTLNLTQCYASLGVPMPPGFVLTVFAAPISTEPNAGPALVSSNVVIPLQP